MKKVLLCLSILLSHFGYGQLVLSGVLSDSATDKPLSGAAISCVFTNNTDSFSVKVISDPRGRFAFRVPEPGRYRITATHVNYQTFLIAVNVTRDTSIQIKLAIISRQLAAVAVSSTRRLIEHTADKITYNLQNDPSAKSQTALDLLAKTPMVSVDGAGTILLNGQSNFKIFLNGKETAMFANNTTEVLRGFSGAGISRIEVITNPSAKYDAEGVGGIINIITRAKVAGFRGTLSPRINSNKTANLGLNLALKSGKLGVTGNFNRFTIFNQPFEFNSTSVTLVPSAFVSTVNAGPGKNNATFQNGNLEMSYDMDSLDIVSVYGNAAGGRFQNDRDQKLTTLFSNGNKETADLNTLFITSSPAYSIGADFLRKGKRNHTNEFSIRLLGDFNENNTYSESEQYYPNYNRFVLSNSEAFSRQLTVQADYTHNFKKEKKLELGVKRIMRYAQSDFSVQTKFDQQSNFIKQPGLTDLFDYRQYVNGYYTSYQCKINAVNVRVGARLESTRITGNFASTGSKVKQGYTSLLPNVQLSFKINSKWSVVANYNKRLERPFIQMLNPFINKSDTLNLLSGNPTLHAQNLHIYSIQNRITVGKHFANVGLFYQYSNDKITPYAAFDQTTGVTLSAPQNIGVEKSLSLILNMNLKLSDALAVNYNLNPRYVWIRNKRTVSERNAGLTGYSNLSGTYNFNKTFSLSLSCNGGMPPAQIQTSFVLFWGYTLNPTVKLFNEKLFLNFFAQNIHKKMFELGTVLRTNQIETRNFFSNMYRIFGFGVAYNFGSLKQSVSKKRAVVNDDQVN